MDFRSRLKDTMEFADMQYKELSQKTGITERALYTYVASKNPSMPPADVAVKIAQVLGVSVEYLVNGTKSTGAIPAEHRKLIADFSALSANDRKSVLALIAEMKTH